MVDTEELYSDRHGNSVSVFVDESGNVTEREPSPATGWRVLRSRVNGGVIWEPDIAEADCWCYLDQQIELDEIHKDFSHLISEIVIDHGGVVEFIRKDGAAAQTLPDDFLQENLKLFFEGSLDEVFLVDADKESILQLKRNEDGEAFFNEDFEGGNEIPLIFITPKDVMTFVGAWIERYNRKL